MSFILFANSIVPHTLSLVIV